MLNSISTFKKILFSALSIASSVLANQEYCCEQTQEATSYCFSQPLIEVKTGYFFFSNSKMRDVYDDGGFDVQLSLSYPVWNLVSGWTLNIYGALEYLQCSGNSINAHQKTSFCSVPVNLGLKPVYAINDYMQYYFAIGPRYFYIHQHNHSSYVYNNKSRSGLGFFINTGLNYLICDCFMIDLFGEYSYAKTHFHGRTPLVYTRDIQIGGFTFGAGLGYEF